MHNAYSSTARTYWTDYVANHGGPAGVASLLNIPYSTIAGICNGSRGIGRRLAMRLQERSNGELDASQLVWILPDFANEPSAKQGRAA